MITLSGQLAIRTIHGRNGDFNVGRLATSIGEFVIKNAELDQYREGKYEGDFAITEIRPSTYHTSGRMVIEIRAHLGGMTLSNIDPLSTDEANRLSPQEVDPIDEEAQVSVPTATAPTEAKDGKVTSDPLVDTRPFGASVPDTPARPDVQDDDAVLFGMHWPLGDVVKLDATVDRRLLRQQRDRLGALGYEFAPMSQDWHRVPRRHQRPSNHPPGSLPDWERSGFFRRTPMGWSFSRQSRAQLIHELIQPQDGERAHHEVIAHTLRGNVLWSVVRVTAKEAGILGLGIGESTSYIRCDLLQGSGDEWGYKPLEESMHPYYYSCPLRYLDMAPEKCGEWREGVRAYHARRRARRGPAAMTG